MVQLADRSITHLFSPAFHVQPNKMVNAGLFKDHSPDEGKKIFHYGANG
jgi:hypothetical protein